MGALGSGPDGDSSRFRGLLRGPFQLLSFDSRLFSPLPLSYRLRLQHGEDLQEAVGDGAVVPRGVPGEERERGFEGAEEVGGLSEATLLAAGGEGAELADDLGAEGAVARVGDQITQGGLEEEQATGDSGQGVGNLEGLLASRLLKKS